MATPEAVEIRALSLCLTVVAFFLGVQLDIRGNVEEVEQVRLKLAGMLLASCWAGPLTIVAGFYAYPRSWKLLQPFHGGGGFVVVQAVGWLLYGISLFVMAVACLNARHLATTAALPRGVYASLGSLAASAQATLNFSLGLFEEEEEQKMESTRRRSWWYVVGIASGGMTKAPLTALSLMLAVAGMVLTASGDEIVRGLFCSRLAAAQRCSSLGAAASGALVWTGAASHGLASVLTHGVHGRVAHGSRYYRLFMPFEGGAPFVLLQALAWTLWGLVVDVLVAVSAKKIAKIPGGPTTLGLCCLVANVVLVSAIDLFHPAETGTRRCVASEEEEDDDQDSSSLNRRRPRRRKDVVSPERVVAKLFVVLSLVAFVVGMALRPVYSPRGPPPAYAMATVLCHLAPPLAHLGGARTTPGYGVIMVGQGGPRFVVAQGCGWMLYAFSLLSSIVLVVNGARRFNALVRGAAPLAVLSSGLLVASVGLFDPAVVDEDPPSPHPEPVVLAPVWRIRCDPDALSGPSLVRVSNRRLHRSLLASKALAASLAARDALDDIAKLRAMATTPTVQALLDAAQASLLGAQDSALIADEDDDDDDDLDLVERDNIIIEEDDDEKKPTPVKDDANNEEKPPPVMPVSEETSMPSPTEGPTKRLVLARDLDHPGSRPLQFLRDAASLFAAPLASLIGIALFAGADLFGPPEDKFITPGRYVLSPVLALCAFVAILAAAPLQFHLERRFPPAAPGKRRRFVALRLVALAAWSFAVLVALAALLRYTACNGCALALSIGRRVSGALSLRSPLGACGWGGLLVQLLVLVCAPPADSLQAAFGLIGRRRVSRKETSSTSGGGPKKKMTTTPATPPKTKERDWYGRWLYDDDDSSEKTLLGAQMPEDAWRQVETFLAFSDLCTLAAAAKEPRWCAAYTRAARWRRLFAARGCGGFSHEISQRVPPRARYNLIEERRHHGGRFKRRSDIVDGLLDGARWFWDSLEAALAGEQDVIDAHFDGDTTTTSRDPQHRLYVQRALRRGVDRRRELRRHGRPQSRALPWKLACVLHERGAPLVRCASCGEVDLGDDREFLAPCPHCPGMYQHRRCLEKDLDLDMDRVPYGTINDGDLVDQWRRERRRTLRCPLCGAGLALATRPPRGPVEVVAVLWRDRRNALRVARRCLQQWTLALLLVTAIARRHGHHSCSCHLVNPVMAWYLLQQTCLFEVFITHRFSAVVARLWSTPTRNAVGFYLRLYFYYIFASAGILASFSPLPLLFADHPRRDEEPSLATRCVRGTFAVLAWVNVLLYFAVSSSCLYIFVKTHYRLPTVASTRLRGSVVN